MVSMALTSWGRDCGGFNEPITARPASRAATSRRHATAICSAGENSTGLMGSGRVHRHSHRRNRSAPACGFSCRPGDTMASWNTAWVQTYHLIVGASAAVDC
jgi:hypothetical protein